MYSIRQISGYNLVINLTHVFHVQRILSKLAKQKSFINRLNIFTSSSVMIKFHKTYMNAIIQYGRLMYGCTRKSISKDIFHVQKKTLCILFFKNQRFASDELLERSQIVSVFDHYVFELLKFGVDTWRGSQLSNIKTLNIYEKSPVFTWSICCDMFNELGILKSKVCVIEERDLKCIKNLRSNCCV